MLLISPFGDFCSNGNVRGLYVSGQTNVSMLKGKGLLDAEIFFNPLATPEDKDKERIQRSGPVVFGRVGRNDSFIFDPISLQAFAKLEHEFGAQVKYIYVNPSIEARELVENLKLQRVEFREWLKKNLSSMKPIKAIGKEKYEWFFNNIALVPFSTAELRLIGEIEWDRAVTLEHLTANKYRKVAVPPIPKTDVEQVANEAKAEVQVRDFYENEGILSQPNSLKHYLTAPLPTYLAPIKWLGVTDDLTGQSRVDEDGYSYVPKPHDQLPYFYAANARDTRAGIVHEGAHYQQLAISWRHERKLRRHYYDSGVNEGIAFYNEELLLAAGLFDDAVHSKTVMYNFMKLRAMRVIVDVALATGEIDIPTATAYLERKVPMDHGTAYEEAVFFSSCPGQALTYQIGKTQIIKLFSDAVSKQRANNKDFDMKEFHDYLWLNGNVPLSLLRFEYLDDASEIASIEKAKNQSTLKR